MGMNAWRKEALRVYICNIDLDTCVLKVVRRRRRWKRLRLRSNATRLAT